MLRKASADGKIPADARLTSQKEKGAQSISVSTVEGWRIGEEQDFVIYEVNSNNEVIAGSVTSWKGVSASNGTIANLTITGGIDRLYPIGAVVTPTTTSAWANDLISGLLKSHNPDGTLKESALPAIKPQVIPNKSITADKIDFTTMPDNKYSTDEINTGKKWINGKTIFQKTFAMGGLGRATTIKKPHNISNLDLVVRIQGIAKENSIGATINLPHAADQQPYTVTVYADNTNVNIQTYADQSGYAQSYVTLWYTKK
nr:MAG TPA: hypothetical protein [Caudoviricetes sp.]